MYKFYFIFISFVLIANISIANNSSGDNLKKLQKQLKSKDATQVYKATAELAALYRQEGELKKAEQLLKKFQSPSGFDRLPPKEAIPYLRCLLETAHLRALNKDVTGSLSLLNWAEGRKQDYERAISCIKYADILIDLNEPDRAKSYLKNANDLINKHLGGDADQGAAIGQGSKVVDTGASWRLLQDQSDYVAAIVEELQLSKKFGATYGLYVKLRRLQRIVKRSHSPRYFNEAMRLCDEIVDMDPSSQFAQAAGYLKGKILFTAIPDQEGKAQKEAIKKAKQCLDKFIKSDPEGLYRGESMMMMGKICLEKEWNAKEAEKYYSQALTWFQNARKKRDALSLYAPISNDLKRQTQATQRPTTLNRWKRVVYHEEDPLRLYNTAVAPSWYIDDKEKNCLFMVGFLSFVNGKYEAAVTCWDKAGKLDPTIIQLQTTKFPNTLMRIKIAAKQGFFVTDSIEHKGLSSKEKLKVLIGEFYYMEEKFEEGVKYWKGLQKELDISPTCMAIALMGEADCLRLLPKCNTKYVASLYNRIINEKTLSKTPLKARAMYNLAWITLQSSSKNTKLASDLFDRCFKENRKSKYAEAALFYLVLINLHRNYPIASKYVEKYRTNYPNGIYTQRMELRLKEYKFKKEKKNAKG